MRCNSCDALITRDMTRCAQCGWIVKLEQAIEPAPVPFRTNAIQSRPKSGEPRRNPANNRPRFEPFDRSLGALKAAIDPRYTSKNARKNRKASKYQVDADMRNVNNEIRCPKKKNSVAGTIVVVPLVIESICVKSRSERLMPNHGSEHFGVYEDCKCWSYKLQTERIAGPNVNFDYEPLHKQPDYTTWVDEKSPVPDSPEAARIFRKLGWEVLRRMPGNLKDYHEVQLVKEIRVFASCNGKQIE